MIVLQHTDLLASDMNITRGEAKQIGGDFYFYPGTDIATIELSTFHILHCLASPPWAFGVYLLTRIRTTFENLSTQSTTGPTASQKHCSSTSVRSPREHRSQANKLDHCIDAIRQYIQCHVDLTPINLVWSENKGGVLPDFQQAHTCRSFTQAQKWVHRRNIANYEEGIGDEGVAYDARRTLHHFGWD